MQEQNFADEIYKIFKSKHRTALRCNDLTDAYKKKYARPLNTTELRELPFIQFERNGGNNNMIYLVVELDDCCNKCKFRYCKLLHSVDSNDKFLPYHSHSQSNSDSKTNDTPNNKSKKLSPIERPSIRLIQRVKDILNESNSNPKQVTLRDMKKRHNRKYPTFKTHEPTSHGIAIRFKSTFHIGYDDQTGDHLITFKHDQNHQNLSNQYKKNRNINGYKKSNVIINSKKSHQSPWQKKSKPKTTKSTDPASPTMPNKAALNKYNKTPIKKQKTKPKTKTNEIIDISPIPLQSSSSKSNDEIDTPKKEEIPPKTPKKTDKNDGELLPEYPNKHYLSIAISPEWNDSKLIPDLVRHISQHTGKHIGDAYINHRIRVGFFTAKTNKIAQEFVRSTRDRNVKCWGRTVSAEIVPLPRNTNNGSLGHAAIQRQQSGHRVKIENVNCIMGRKDFEAWVHEVSNTGRRKHLVYDIEIVFPKVPKGAKQCIMLFDTFGDTKYVLDRIQNREFRGFPLVFKHWRHPNYSGHKTKGSNNMNGTESNHSPKSNKRERNKRKRERKRKEDSKRDRNGKNKQKSKAVNSTSVAVVSNKSAIRSSKPQRNIWAKMASKRKEDKQRKVQKPSAEKGDIDNASVKSTKSSKSSASKGSKAESKQPLQPTKPPKKLVIPLLANHSQTNNDSHTIVNNESNSETITIPSMNELKNGIPTNSNSNGNGNARKPPLINSSINRFLNSNDSNSNAIVSQTIEQTTEMTNEEMKEEITAKDSDDSTPKEDIAEEITEIAIESTEPTKPTIKTPEIEETKPETKTEITNEGIPDTDASKEQKQTIEIEANINHSKFNKEMAPSQPQPPPVNTIQLQPPPMTANINPTTLSHTNTIPAPTAQTATPQQHFINAAANNINLLQTANAHLLQAQRQFNQLSSNPHSQLQMHPLYISQLQQLQAQQQQLHAQAPALGQPIRIVPINHLQQIQQLQQLQAQQYHSQIQALPSININTSINGLPNIYTPQYNQITQLTNMPTNINISPYAITPNTAAFNNIQNITFTPTPAPQSNNINSPNQNRNGNGNGINNNKRTSAYQSPPRHQQQRQSYNNNNSQNQNQSNANKETNFYYQ